MADAKSTNHATREERMELARGANTAIQGLSEELLRMVREQRIDSDATKHRAALGMLATIQDLSDDIFGLVFGDPDDEVTREEAKKIARKLGVSWSEVCPEGAGYA